MRGPDCQPKGGVSSKTMMSHYRWSHIIHLYAPGSPGAREKGREIDGKRRKGEPGATRLSGQALVRPEPGMSWEM